METEGLGGLWRLRRRRRTVKVLKNEEILIPDRRSYSYDLVLPEALLDLKFFAWKQVLALAIESFFHARLRILASESSLPRPVFV